MRRSRLSRSRLSRSRLSSARLSGARPTGSSGADSAAEPGLAVGEDELVRYVREARRPLLVLVDAALDARVRSALEGATDVDVRPLSSALPPGRSRWDTALVVADTRQSLRAEAAGLPPVGRARAVGCWLARSAAPVLIQPHPAWPPVRRASARPVAEGQLNVIRFGAAVPVASVVEMFARAAGGSHRAPLPVVAVVGTDPGALSEAGPNPRTVRVSSPVDAADPQRVVPPDAVVTTSPVELSAHHVIDRAPVVVSPAPIPPIDESVFRPTGFRTAWEAPAAGVSPVGHLELGEGEVVDLAALDERVLARLRDLQGVRIEAIDPTDPTLRRGVVALAMAGVPLLGTAEFARQRDVLGAELADALLAPADLDDAVAREEHSIRVRRAALDRHSFGARAAKVGDQAGAGVRRFPAVSVLLTTFRPDRVADAVRQVADQAGADIELVLATHGFTADPVVVREQAGGLPVTIVERSADVLFGEVLAAAERAASGQVLLKWDDDDHYGSEFVHDLLLARSYSGAELVGTSFQFVYLAEADVTLRRRLPTEVYADHLAGGTLMIDRGLFHDVGGFRPVRRFVDAQLLTAVRAAGASIYRAHALGYVLRRGASAGHTWAREAEDFRSDPNLLEEWPGYRPPPSLRQ